MNMSQQEINKAMKAGLKQDDKPQVAKSFYTKMDKRIYKDQLSNLKASGFSLAGLKEKYDQIPSSGFRKVFNKDQILEYKFGLSNNNLPHSLYTGQKGVTSEYIKTRLETLNEIIALIDEAVKADPQDLTAKHKIAALLELSKEAAGGKQENAPHYQEIIEAAKTVVEQNPSAKANFKDYEKSFIYDNQSLIATLNELSMRRDHLLNIKNEGFKSANVINRATDYLANEYGVGGLVGDSFRLTAAKSVTSAITTSWKGEVRMDTHKFNKNKEEISKLQKEAKQYLAEGKNYRTSSNSDLWSQKKADINRKTYLNRARNHKTKISELRTANKALSKNITGLRKNAGWTYRIFSNAGKGLKYIPKVLGLGGPTALVGLGVLGTITLVDACTNKDSYWGETAKSVKNFFYGSDNWGSALLTTVIPFYGIAEAVFTEFRGEQYNNLQQIKKGVTA